MGAGLLRTSGQGEGEELRAGALPTLLGWAAVKEVRFSYYNNMDI